MRQDRLVYISILPFTFEDFTLLTLLDRSIRHFNTEEECDSFIYLFIPF